MKAFVLPLLLILAVLVRGNLRTEKIIQRNGTYRAAVVEYNPLNSSLYNAPLDIMIANVEIYEKYAVNASEQGADIIVFPEYGITTLLPLDSRDVAQTFAVVVPDPKLVSWNPCLNEDEFPDVNVMVLTSLSCAARRNSIVLVVNLVSKMECDPDDADSKCPSDGRFQFNTNVAFSKDGTLLARYHKRHLYGEEPAINPAPEVDFAIFDAGFGRFGMFICFDILYEDPAVQLVTAHGIRNLIFSTMWGDQLPFRSAIETQQSYAYGLKVNLLASNYFRPEEGQIGSGIYSSVKGAIKYTNDPSSPGTMLVADVPVVPAVSSDGKNNEDASNDDSTSTESDRGTRLFKHESLSNYEHIFIDNTTSTARICHNDVCCRASYDFGGYSSGEVYAVVAHDDFRKPSKYPRYFQACAVIRCENTDIESCGQVPSNLTTIRFESLKLIGNFTTEFLFPSILTARFDLLPTELWDFTKEARNFSKEGHVPSRFIGTIETTAFVPKPLLAFAVIGRHFNRDEN